MSKQCPNVSLRSCFHCKRLGHHRSICPTKHEGTTSVEEVKKTSVIISSSEDKPPPNSEQKPTDTASIVSNALFASGERVLLQTAQVIVCGAQGVEAQASVLMDSASHRTFMTKQMAKKLNLQPQRKETLFLSTLGTKKPQNLEMSVVTTKKGLSVILHTNKLLVLSEEALCP